MANYTKINEDVLSYQKIKQLDLESEKKMTEGKGPADECICHILAPPDDRSGKGIGGTMKDSIKRAIKTMSGSVKRRSIGGGAGGGAAAAGGFGTRGGGSCVNPECDGNVGRGGGIFIPLTTTKGGKGIFTTKETLKRTKPCGKCGCDKENIVMKHSYANIKIISPDVSSICPCPNNCLNTEALNNIKVTVERLELNNSTKATVEGLELHPDTSDSEASVSSQPPGMPEPVIERRSISELIDAQYDCGTPEEDHAAVCLQEQDDVSEWSFGIPVGEEEEEETEDEAEEDRTSHHSTVSEMKEVVTPNPV